MTQDSTSVDENTSICHLNDTASRESLAHLEPKKTTTAGKLQHANDYFRDVSETGVWGNVTNSEIYLVGFLAATIILTGLGFIVSAVIEYSSTKLQHRAAIERISAGATTEILFLKPDHYYKALVDHIKNHPYINGSVGEILTMHLPVDLDDLTAKDPYSTAAQWLLYGDPSHVKTNVTMIPRFVLATTYYANNGQSWYASDAWLSPSHVCDWEGVTCEQNHQIVEVDLSHNNLTGTLHMAWGLLEGCISLLLEDNALTGPIDDLLTTADDLAILRLQNNRLSGTIPSAFLPHLGMCTQLVCVRFLTLCDPDTLYVHGNRNLTGIWPDCEALQYFGLDCELIECVCCTRKHNCF